MTIQLNNDLIDFFDDIEIKFQWNDKFYLDFLSYFPLLKKGLTTKRTYYNVIAAYGLTNKFISPNEILEKIDDDIIIKIYNSYVKSCNIYIILNDNFSDDFLLSISPVNNKTLHSINKNINDTISKELKNEQVLSLSLLNGMLKRYKK